MESESEDSSTEEEEEEEAQEKPDDTGLITPAEGIYLNVTFSFNKLSKYLIQIPVYYPQSFY